MNSNVEQSGATLALNSGGFAIGSTTSQYSIATAINYLYRGVFGQRATAATQALVIEPNTGVLPTVPQALQAIPAGNSGTFLVCVNPVDNALTVVQGVPAPTDQVTASVAAVPNGKLAVAVIKVVNASAADFIPGTTAFNAASITTTYTNVGSHPGRSI